jgi:hypothetical protein
VKLILKLVIVGLVANAAFHLMTAYTSYWKFKDAVAQTTQFGNDKSLDTLKRRIVELAIEYDLPMDEGDFTIARSRETLHTVVDGSYTRDIDLLPGYSRPWKFDFKVDTFSDAPIKEERPRD